MPLTHLQFEILNAMMDDSEDVEQIYLAVNRKVLEMSGEISCGQPKYQLVLVIDEIGRLLEGGLLEARISWDESVAPLDPVNQAKFHYYWFGPTEKGKAEWKNRDG